MKKIKISKLGKYIVFSFAMVILMTISTLILQTLHPDVDYTVYYSVFCGIFGGETLGCALIKCMNIKKENSEL